MPDWPGSKVTVFDTVRRKARTKIQAEPQADEMWAIIKRQDNQCQGVFKHKMSQIRGG